MLAVREGVELDAGNFALAVDRHCELYRLAGIALGGGQADNIAETGGLTVQPLNGFGHVGKGRSRGIGRVIERLEILRVGHDLKQRFIDRGGAVCRDDGRGIGIDAGDAEHHNCENEHKDND